MIIKQWGKKGSNRVKPMSMNVNVKYKGREKNFRPEPPKQNADNSLENFLFKVVISLFKLSNQKVWPKAH